MFAEVTAAPIEIEINGQKVNLHPLTLEDWSTFWPAIEKPFKDEIRKTIEALSSNPNLPLDNILELRDRLYIRASMNDAVQWAYTAEGQKAILDRLISNEGMTPPKKYFNVLDFDITPLLGLRKVTLNSKKEEAITPPQTT